MADNNETGTTEQEAPKSKGCLAKIAKALLWTLGITVVLALVLLAAAPLWVGPTVKGVANCVVPGITKTGFNIGNFTFNPYTGRVELNDMTLSNPEGCSVEDAVKIGTFRVVADFPSLVTDNILIHEITLDGFFASYVDYKDPADPEFKGSNFDWILKNVLGDEEKDEEEEEDKSDAGNKKVVIEDLTLKNISFRYGLVTIPVPVTIHLTDIGKESEMTLKELPLYIWNKLVAVAGGLTEFAGALGAGALKIGGQAIGAAADLATGALGTATDALKNVDVGAATDALKNVGSGAADLATGALGTATDALKNVDVGAAADTLKNVGSGAADLATDALGTATDALKNVDVGAAADATVDTLKNIGGGAVDTASGLLKSAGGLFK
ncbi:MAG: hypothetical protein IJ802_00690 [Kiritimatiellae bacterium]|nr:hypothetical protein [Kiritimatiellia bacterium]